MHSTTSQVTRSYTPLFASAATPSLLHISTGLERESDRRKRRGVGEVDDGASSVHGGSVRTTRSSMSSFSTQRSQLERLPPAARAIALRVANSQQRGEGVKSKNGGEFVGIFD